MEGDAALQMIYGKWRSDALRSSSSLVLVTLRASIRLRPWRTRGTPTRRSPAHHPPSEGGVAVACALWCAAAAREGLTSKVICRSEVAWRDNGITSQWRATPRVPGDSCILRPRMGTGNPFGCGGGSISFILLSIVGGLAESTTCMPLPLADDALTDCQPSRDHGDGRRHGGWYYDRRFLH